MLRKDVFISMASVEKEKTLDGDQADIMFPGQYDRFLASVFPNQQKTYRFLPIMIMSDDNLDHLENKA